MAPSRDAAVTLSDPFVMGVDVARFGDYRSVIRTAPWPQRTQRFMDQANGGRHNAASVTFLTSRARGVH
jgi:hypothetical protein